MACASDFAACAVPDFGITTLELDRDGFGDGFDVAKVWR